MSNLYFLEGLPRVDTALHGPAHPDEFRVKIGRFAERFYHDPLPACPLADTCDDAWPSVTTVKNAAGKDWSWTSLERAATYLDTRRGELAGMNAAEIHARLIQVNKDGLNRAGARGSKIHEVMEALAAGGRLPNLSDEAKPYLPACQRFLDEAQPEWLLSEVVTISRTHGYGGTFDAVIRINGETFLVDWKTRKPGKHGAYDEEAWQLAAYANADYMIVDRDGTAVREVMPPLDGAYIISLAPEGYRPYPVKLDESWQSYLSLRGFWSRKRVEHVGKPVRFVTVVNVGSTVVGPAVVTVSEPDALVTTTVTTNPATFGLVLPEPDDGPPIAPVDLLPEAQLRDWILGRLKALDHGDHANARAAMKARWPHGVPGFRGGHRHSKTELDAIRVVLDVVEADFEIPFGQTDPTTVRPAPVVVPETRPAIIDEGPYINNDELRDILAVVNELDGARTAVINEWARDANAVGRTFSIKLVRSQRRLNIYRVILNLAPLIEFDEANGDMPDDDLVRATIALVIPDVAMPTTSIGEALGVLTIDEAARLADIAKAVAADPPALTYDPDNGAARWANHPQPDQSNNKQEETN